MVKAQVFLRSDQKKQLCALAARTGRKQSALIRQGVDLIIAAEARRDDWKAGLMQAAGMWKDRDDIPRLMRKLRQDSVKRPKRLFG